MSKAIRMREVQGIIARSLHFRLNKVNLERDLRMAGYLVDEVSIQPRGEYMARNENEFIIWLRLEHDSQFRRLRYRVSVTEVND